MTLYYIAAFRLPYFHIDDVFVSGFCAARCGFPRKHHLQITEAPVHPNDENVRWEELVLRHHMSNNHKKVIYQMMAEKKNATAAERS